jgi:hypothetical protein
MRNLTFACVVSAILLGLAWPAHADSDEPPIWPSVRYGAPDRLAAGVAIQPPLPGVLGSVIGIASWGQDARRAGVGIGRFGGCLMGGYAVLATVLWTKPQAPGTTRGQTFLGVEAELMLGNFSLREPVPRGATATAPNPAAAFVSTGASDSASENRIGILGP